MFKLWYNSIVEIPEQIFNSFPDFSMIRSSLFELRLPSGNVELPILRFPSDSAMNLFCFKITVALRKYGPNESSLRDISP